MHFKTPILTALATSVAVLGLAGAAQAQDKEIVTVVKVTGENWFTRMEEGVTAYNEETDGISARQVGPGRADAAQQAAIVQDLIAQGVDALAIVPMDPSTLEGVLRRAQQRGVTVITHEADNMQNTQLDLEAFDNAEFGAHFAEDIAECMGN